MTGPWTARAPRPGAGPAETRSRRRVGRGRAGTPAAPASGDPCGLADALLRVVGGRAALARRPGVSRSSRCRPPIGNGRAARHAEPPRLAAPRLRRRSRCRCAGRWLTASAGSSATPARGAAARRGSHRSSPSWLRSIEKAAQTRPGPDAIRHRAARPTLWRARRRRPGPVRPARALQPFLAGAPHQVRAGERLDGPHQQRRPARPSASVTTFRQLYMP